MSGRTLILCFDGTSNRYNEKNTNVVKFMSLLHIDEPDKQLVYYQPGLGTYTNPGIFTPIAMKIAEVLDFGIAWYIGAHITGGYKWLMNKYQQGDRICIFGFSRGAYTARALAGMINKVGLLPAGNEEQVTIAYDLYRADTKEGYTLSDGFRDTFSRMVPIEFVGVWDSVSSVGLIRSQTLPYAASNNIIATFRHAMALDEHRCWFTVDPWHIPTSPNPNLFRLFLSRALGLKIDPDKQSLFARLLEWIAYGGSKHMPAVERGGRPSGATADQLFGIPPNVKPPTDVKEVWFVGNHSDIGGSNDVDALTRSLAHITLRWMVRECQKSNAGILWNVPRLAQFRIDLSPGRLATSDNIEVQAPDLRSKGAAPSYTQHFAPMLASFEDRNEIEDTQEPTHDSLKPHWTWPSWFPLGFNLLWWILELIPMRYWWQDQKGQWRGGWSINFGRARQIRPQTGPAGPDVRFHISVLAKEQNQRYSPRANLPKGTVPLYVD